MLDIINHTMKTVEKDKVVWPPGLLYRAAWLGLDQLAGRLLELGCVPEPESLL